MKPLPPTHITELKPSDASVKLPHRLLPGESVDLNLTVTDNKEKRRFLHIAGFVDDIKGGEGGFRRRYHYLNECAVKKGDNSIDYFLKVRGWGKDFKQCAYCKIAGNQFTAGQNAEIKVNVSGKELEYGKGGYAGIRVECYLKGTTFAGENISRKPEYSYFLPFPKGNFNEQVLKKTFRIPDSCTDILLTVEGKNFTGSFSLDLPVFTENEKKISIPPFTPDSKLWAGSNISRIAWPEFEFSIDGKPFLKEPIFQRAANTEIDFEIKLPNGLVKGSHKLTFKLLRTYAKDKGYTLNYILMLEENARAYELIGVPDFVPENSEFSAMVEINKPNTTLSISSTEGAIPIAESVTFQSKGIYALPFKSEKHGNSPVIKVSDGKRSSELKVKMITAEKSDRILLSTSDWIYTGSREFNKYFKWLYANNIINSIVVRPSYQWNGTRTREEKFFRKFKVLCENFRLPYALMVEGRCLPGANINPKDRWLNGKYYLGRQAHEDDGSYYYWGPWGPYSTQLVRLLMGRFLDGGGIFPKFRYSNSYAHNMKEGAEYFISNLIRAKHTSTRHTGPSVLFRYFYQAGYQWLGAEQGYGPEEIIVSAIRGAAKAYGKHRFGSHHATQWGGGYRVEDQFKAHAVAYMHGVTHINTEDALWDTEGLNYRFSQKGLEHVARQRDIMDFILTHRRFGKFIAKIAVLQGKYDGWASFGKQPIWGQAGNEWKAGDAEASFDLLKVFYPRKKMQGFSFGGTPYGPIDLLPVEAPLDVLDQYSTLIFLGWNTYDENYFSRLKKFVQNGGTLLMTLAHLNTNLKHNGEIILPEKSDFYQTLKAKLKGGNPLQPQEIKLGHGRVIIFNTKKYPGNSELHDKYADVMRNIGDKTIDSERNYGWIKGSKEVDFTVWDDIRNNSKYRTIYLLNTKSDKPYSVNLLLGKHESELKIKPGIIKTVTISQGLAVMSSDQLTSVLKINRDNKQVTLTVQVINPCKVTVVDSISGTEKTIDINSAGIITRKIDL